MSVDHSALGGRLPLYDRESLDPAQKELFDWLMNAAVPWAADADFQACTETGRLIGPFNAALLTPAISSAFIELAVAEQKDTSLGKRSREVIILTVGAVWQAPYELYAHCAVGRHVGLSDDAVRTLADGGLPKDLTDAETVAHRVARALSLERHLDEALYREAEALLGPDGVMETVVLTGIYHTVCAILNAFEIPAPS
ncbi:MAG TPA: carboxymuconolactone decarboxylase family protein [Mycobacterium sp.]|uniref:carboxymuconolactone decarboxylase family protein n=1 Tax=Mycobacterium sp. TaxID=1785 RepID=UPI002BEF7A67|nr:carboxymuconolactone decarboxylase family protein [Mycobacterium sp.]HME77512.1 carboxymuconolactone decarboxylase family protein [Mycobacterium sp.]